MAGQHRLHIRVAVKQRRAEGPIEQVGQKFALITRIGVFRRDRRRAGMGGVGRMILLADLDIGHLALAGDVAEVGESHVVARGLGVTAQAERGAVLRGQIFDVVALIARHEIEQPEPTIVAGLGAAHHHRVAGDWRLLAERAVGRGCVHGLDDGGAVGDRALTASLHPVDDVVGVEDRHARVGAVALVADEGAGHPLVVRGRAGVVAPAGVVAAQQEALDRLDLAVRGRVGGDVGHEMRVGDKGAPVGFSAVRVPAGLEVRPAGGGPRRRCRLGHGRRCRRGLRGQRAVRGIGAGHGSEHGQSNEASVDHRRPPPTRSSWTFLRQVVFCHAPSGRLQRPESAPVPALRG